MIKRILEDSVTKHLNSGKAIIIYGARQVGKTTLLRQAITAPDTLWLNGDEADVRALFENPTSSRIKSVIGKSKTLVVDEAQRITDIGLCLKLIIDNMPDVQVVATGSSSFALANKVNEPLTGRIFDVSVVLCRISGIQWFACREAFVADTPCVWHIS